MPIQPQSILIARSAVRDLLYAESTNAARTMKRQDGVSEFDEYVIDSQADSSLDGAWNEATSKLAEKLNEFTTSTELTTSSATYTFSNPTIPNGAGLNARMYVVDYMMADWLGHVRPDYRQQYVDRANIELDDLLRKLYKKEPPV